MADKIHNCEEKSADPFTDEAIIERDADEWTLDVDQDMGGWIVIRFCPFCGVKLE